MLGQRILTAAGLVAVLALVLIVLPRDIAVIALGALILIGAWEWSQLAGLSALGSRVGLRRSLCRRDGGPLVRRRRSLRISRA